MCMAFIFWSLTRETNARCGRFLLAIVNIPRTGALPLWLSAADGILLAIQSLSWLSTFDAPPPF
eukprot:scaffold143729_cov33-Tisochrysis_lutea.AAC.1